MDQGTEVGIIGQQDASLAARSGKHVRVWGAGRVLTHPANVVAIRAERTNNCPCNAFVGKQIH